MADQINVINQPENPLDLTEILNTFGNEWSMKNKGCAGTVFLIPHDPSKQGVRVSYNFTATYDKPIENISTTSHNVYTFQNITREFTTQQLPLNLTTPIVENWKLTNTVCPGGNDFFTITKSKPLLGVSGVPSPDVLEISCEEDVTHHHSYTWNFNQMIRLLPRSSTKVTFQTQLKQITRNFQFVFFMTGNIGVSTMKPVNGTTETYFPITEVLQWYPSDLLTLDFELNKVTCLNKGIYTATYQVEPQLLIQSQSLDDSTLIQESILSLTTGEMIPVPKPNGCCE